MVDWCIGPTDPNQLNTFVERPAIQARLIFWLSALHHVDGMLYYSVNRWTEVAGNCSEPSAACQPLRRINNTALTDFNPATFRDANGDGSIDWNEFQTVFGGENVVAKGISRSYRRVLVRL